MAVYPCDFSRHRYPQAQQSVYATHVIGHVADTYKLRLCPTHFREVQVICREELAVLDEVTQLASVCHRCGKETAGALFVKLFPAKSEQEQFVGDLCASCLSDVGNELHIFNGSTLGGPTDGLP